MKDSYYFPHDYNARGDEKITQLIMELGWEGYGLYWGIVEKLYEAKGKLEADFKRLSFSLHTDEKKLQAVVNCAGLFYRKGKFFGSKSVDRRLEERIAKSMLAQTAANSRWSASAMQTHSDRNAIKERKEIKEIKERKEITTANPPKAVDFSEIRFPYGKHKGALIDNLPADECQLYLNDPRLGSKIRRALEGRISSKIGDMTDEQRKAQKIT